MVDFPNVPFAPGVPSLPRDPLALVSTLVLLTADLVSALAGIPFPRWGLYLAGMPALDADSVLSFDYKQSWQVSTYPVEQGAFESYDKVETPFDVKFRYVSGGSEARRQALIDSIDAIADDLTLYDAITPEKTYSNVCISHYDYRRHAAAGLGMIVLDVWCTEIRINTQTDFASVQSPSAANPVQTGTVQPVAPTAAQTNAFVGF